MCVCVCVCVRMINFLLWLILNWWNKDGVKLNMRLKTLKIWLACFIWCRCDRCVQSKSVAMAFVELNIFKRFIEIMSILRGFFRALGQGDRNTPQPSRSGRRARSPREQEWRKCARLVVWKHGSSDDITSRLLYANGSPHRPCVGRQRRTAEGGGFAVAWHTPLGHNVRIFHCYEKIR